MDSSLLFTNISSLSILLSTTDNWRFFIELVLSRRTVIKILNIKDQGQKPLLLLRMIIKSIVLSQLNFNFRESFRNVIWAAVPRYNLYVAIFQNSFKQCLKGIELTSKW